MKGKVHLGKLTCLKLEGFRWKGNPVKQTWEHSRGARWQRTKSFVPSISSPGISFPEYFTLKKHKRKQAGQACQLPEHRNPSAYKHWTPSSLFSRSPLAYISRALLHCLWCWKGPVPTLADFHCSLLGFESICTERAGHLGIHYTSAFSRGKPWRCYH